TAAHFSSRRDDCAGLMSTAYILPGSSSNRVRVLQAPEVTVMSVSPGLTAKASRSDAGSSQLIPNRSSTNATWSFELALIFLPSSNCSCTLQRALPVVQRGKTDSVTRRDNFDFLLPFRGDKASSLGERFEPSFESEHHSFQH